MIPNRSYLQKADLEIADMQNDGGYLQEEQAKNFFKIMIKQSEFMRMMRVETMKSHTKEFPKTQLGTRILQPGRSATPLTLGERSKPNFDQIALVAQLFKAEIRIDDETLEDNIEKGSFQALVMSMMAERTAADMEDNILNGDTASAVAALQPFDGLRKQAVSNIVLAGGVTLDEDICRDLLKSIPSEFTRDKKRLKFLTSHNAEIDYRHSLGGRGTDHGDHHLGSARAGGPSSVFYAGIEVVPIPLMPENLGGGTNETEVLLANTKDALLGMYRQVRVELGRDKQSGYNYIVTTTRFDTKWMHEPAMAKATGVLAA